MKVTAKIVALEEIQPWREMYRHEMNCQIIHDSIHGRAGWTIEYALTADGVVAGYCSVAVAGPWKEKPTVYEFFVAPNWRTRVFDFFEAFLKTAKPVAMEVQSNCTLSFVMLECYAKNIFTESILFRDEVTTHGTPKGAKFRKSVEKDAAAVAEFELDDGAKWGVEFEGKLVAAGDILYHYNRPYGDIYMKVGERFRKRGFGAFLVQELKRVCYEGGCIPGARCNPKNVASRKTLQMAGFSPFGHILVGKLTK